MVFFGFVFVSGFHVIVVCFWCVWHSSKSVKNAFYFFPVLGGFVGWFVLAYLGLKGLGVFVFLVFVFLFCVAFVSVFVCFVFLFCCWIVLGVLVLFLFFLFCFCFFVFVFWRV